MRTFILTFIYAATLGLAMPSARSNTIIEWERSTDLVTWHQVPAAELLLTESGGIVVPSGTGKEFYRLRVGSGALLHVVPLSEAPEQAVTIARRFLAEILESQNQEEGADPELNWPEDAILSPICYPVFDPSVGNGAAPAYMEFKVIKASAPRTGPDRELIVRPPDESDSVDLGYILVSLTEADAPVPEYSDRGHTKVERLLRRVIGAQGFKPMRFDSGLLIAEDQDGKSVGSIGNEPFQIDPGIADLGGKEFAGFENATGTEDPQAPRFGARRFESYEELKREFATGSLFQLLRQERARMAQPQWTLIKGPPPVFRVGLRESLTVLANRPVREATLENPRLATLDLRATSPGLIITGLMDGGSVLRVLFTDGSSEEFILIVGDGGGVEGLSWTSWKSNYAGNWSDQRRYTQFKDDPEMCTSAASGCGPTAWAMLYGWWDRKGSPRLIGNSSLADSPQNNSPSVLDCTRYVWEKVGPLCISGQAATMPWDMKAGRHWAAHRAAGQSIDWSWGVPYMSPGVRNMARNSVLAGRPAIIGIGFYWHYTLAYGYRSREYRWAGVTWDTQRHFKCNMGWAGPDPQWVDGSSVWFATHARYF